VAELLGNVAMSTYKSIEGKGKAALEKFDHFNEVMLFGTPKIPPADLCDYRPVTQQCHVTPNATLCIDSHDDATAWLSCICSSPDVTH
jgi:hypothetical protein